MEASTTPQYAQGNGYAPNDDRPLASYGVLTGAFAVGVGGAVLGLRAAGRELPEGPRAGDLVIAGIATHKLSRLLSKDKVTSFIRAPFVRFEESAGHGEVEESPRGTGLRYAVGELLACPYCLSQWIAAGFALGFVANPRLTRWVGGVYVAETIADFLQIAYRAAEDST